MVAHQHRVLIYTTCYNVVDGVTLTIRKLEQEILAAGHNVCILTTKSGDPANTDMDGTHPNRRVIFMDNGVEIPFLRDPNNPDISYQLGFALSTAVKAQIEDFEPSVIHITCPDSTALHLIQYARDKELPIMGTYHSQIPEYMDHHPGFSWLKPILAAFLRHQYNFLQALYVPTPFMQKHLVDHYKMDSATTLGIWGRGVDAEKFHPLHRSLKFRATLGIADDTTVICWVGRLVPEKRPDIFANVVRRLHEQGLNFHALVIGAGQCEDDVKYLPNTTFCGWMTPDQLAVAYASCDVFLFPSSVETFGNVTLEAAASGLPVVVEAGCSGHLVRTTEEAGCNGFACPAGDEEAFFEATRELVVNEKLRSSCSRAGRLLAESLEKSAVVRVMLDNYSRVTDQFYTEYGGHHANRDRVYRKPDSFVAGSLPRPLLLVLVETLFVVLFQVIWNMTCVFMYMQEGFLTFGGLAPSARGAAAAVAEEGTSATGSATTSSVASSQRRQQQQQPEGVLLMAPSLQSSSLGGDDGPDDMELSDVEMDSDGGSGESQSLLPAASTLSDDETVDLEARPLSSQKQQPDKVVVVSDSTSTRKAYGDGALSHAVASTFVAAMQIQMRMESHLRNTCSSCCNPSLRQAVVKRKNSGEIMMDGDDMLLLPLQHHQQATQQMMMQQRSRSPDRRMVDDSTTVVELLGSSELSNGAGGGHHRLRGRQRDPLQDSIHMVV